MTDDGEQNEVAKKMMELVSKNAQRRAWEESYKSFLEHLQKELQKILPEKTIRHRELFSAANYYFDGRLHGFRPHKVTEHETHFVNMRSFEEHGLKHTLGIFKRHISKPIFNIGPNFDPAAPGTFRCDLYNEKALPVIKESVSRFAEILHIENLAIDMMGTEGSLSLAVSSGELSPAPQSGELALSEAKKKGL